MKMPSLPSTSDRVPQKAACVQFHRRDDPVLAGRQRGHPQISAKGASLAGVATQTPFVGHATTVAPRAARVVR
jgi:hypothetical protein